MQTDQENLSLKEYLKKYRSFYGNTVKEFQEKTDWFYDMEFKSGVYLLMDKPEVLRDTLRIGDSYVSLQIHYSPTSLVWVIRKHYNLDK